MPPGASQSPHELPQPSSPQLRPSHRPTQAEQVDSKVQTKPSPGLQSAADEQPFKQTFSPVGPAPQRLPSGHGFETEQRRVQ